MAERYIPSYQFLRHMQRKAVLVIGTVLIASVAMGSAAFTSGSVDRAATVQVVGDDAAATGLAPGGGANSGVVQYDSNNQLSIDFSDISSNADGINGNANYTIGDHSSATSTYAFNVTNNDDVTRSYTLSYAFSGSPASNSSVTFTAYNSTGSKLVTASNSGSGTFDLGSTETAYVVMEVNSTGTTRADSLSGDLTITVT